MSKTSASKSKLPAFKYFNARGFGEVPRLLLALAGVEYDDVRFNQDTWPAEKPKTPFGQLPILEIDGRTICQSSAIARYLARRYDFYGKSNDEATVIDTVLGILTDCIMTLGRAYYEKDETKKKQLMEENKSEHIPKFLNMLEKMLQVNDKSGYFVGKSITLADVYFFDFGQKMGIDDYDGYPLSKKCRKIVGDNPKIKAWIAKRPETEN